MCVCVCVCVCAWTLTCLNGIKEILPLGFVFDVCINEKAVHLRVNVFNGNLEPIEAPRLGHLHLCTEPLNLAREGDTTSD